MPAECRPACEAELARYRRALELLDAAGGDPLRPFQRRAAAGRVALATSSATHAVLPLLATRAGLRLQLDAGIRSHRRRFGWDGGLWLPECAYAPGLEWRLAEAGVEWFCVDQSAHEEPLEALAPVRTEAGPVALPIDWEAIGWLWSLDGYPSDPAHAQFDGKSLRGMRIWKVGGGAYDPAAAAAAARRQAASSSPRPRPACASTRPPAGAAACSSSRSTPSCSATGGRRARSGCRRCWRAPRRPGCGRVTVPQALAEHEPVERELVASTWGEDKDFRTWDSPAVADLAWGARRLELRLLRALSAGLAATPRRAPPASCWRPRRATGPSSTSAARPATTPTSERPITPGPCWRP